MKLNNAVHLLREYRCVVKELEGTHLFGTCKDITTHNSFKTVEFVIPNSTCSVVWKSLRVCLGAETRLPSGVSFFSLEASGNKKTGVYKACCKWPTMTVANRPLLQSLCSYAFLNVLCISSFHLGAARL
jgi:hypothetical protein